MDPSRRELRRHRARERELRVLGRCVETRRPGARDRAGDGDDVDDVRRARRLERRQERSQAPDPAEVVRFASPPRFAPVWHRRTLSGRGCPRCSRGADAGAAPSPTRRPARRQSGRRRRTPPLRRRAPVRPLRARPRRGRAARIASPRLVRSRATAAPMPFEPPVTTAIRTRGSAMADADVAGRPRLTPGRVRRRSPSALARPSWRLRCARSRCRSRHVLLRRARSAASRRRSRRTRLLRRAGRDAKQRLARHARALGRRRAR